MASRFFRVPVEEMAYLRAILDGHDGLAVMRSLERRRGEVEWMVGDGLDEEVDELVVRLAREIRLQPIPRPDGWPLLGEDRDPDEDRIATEQKSSKKD